MSAVELTVRLFGTVQACVDGEPADLGAHKQRAVLAMLALSAGHVVSVERLIDGVWGDDPPSSAKNAVQVYVTGLRRALTPAAEVIRTEGPGYRLDIESDDVDLLRFEGLLDAADDGDNRREALALWTDQPLADLRDMPFADTVVTRVDELRMQALEDRIQADLDTGRFAGLAVEIEQLLGVSPYRERLWRLAMMSLYREGRQADALEAFQRARRILDEDLGVDPGPALSALEQAVLRQDPALDFHAGELAQGAGLPEIPTPTVGRDDEIALVLDRLQDSRLVSIVGPGGVGKTRLALEVAHRTKAALDDGVVFVDLSAARDHAALTAQLAQAVGASGDGDDLEATCAVLRQKRVLLVLDNTEQLDSAPQVVSTLVRETVGPRFVVTSRMPLRVAAEHVVSLQPLSRDDSQELLSARLLASTGVEPAPRVVHELAARLDDLPLAIELASASCAALGSEAVVDLLSQHLPLPSGPRDLPDRHRTLESLVDWSLDLLPVPDRALLSDLTVFRSPFALSSVAALVSDPDTAGVSATLARLVDASLVLAEADRFRLVQTVRDHVAASLTADQSERLADRHADWVVDVTSRAAQELYGADEDAVRRRLLALIPDFRAGFERLVATERPEEAARVILDVAQAWFHAGRLHEAEAALGRVMDSPGLSPRTRAESMALRGVFAKMTGDSERTVGWIVTGVEGLRAEASDSIALVNSLCHLADVRVNEGLSDDAVTLANEAVAVARRTGDAGTVSMALDLAGYVARAVGDTEAATEAARAALAEVRGRDGLVLADALAGFAAALGKDDPSAAELAWEAIAHAEAAGQPNERAKVVLTVAEVLSESAPADVARMVAESLALYLAISARPAVVEALVILGGAAESADPQAAALLAGAMRRRADNRTPDEAQELVARLRETLGAKSYARAAGAGAALGDDELGRVAFEVARAVARRARETQPSTEPA